MSTWVGLDLAGEGLDVLRERVHGGFDPEKLHMTLVFISQDDLIDEVGPDITRLALDATVERWLRGWTGNNPKGLFTGELHSCSQFGTYSHAVVLSLPRDIVNARLQLVEDLERRGISSDKTYAFNPHITFGLLPKDLMHLDSFYKLCNTGFDYLWGQPITFPSVFVQCGEKRTVFPTYA